jgi:hypothetical protein
MFQKARPKSELSISVDNFIRTCKGVGRNPNSNTLELDWAQRDCPAPYVIAQQHSSANFVSLLFPFLKTKFGAVFESVI